MVTMTMVSGSLIIIICLHQKWRVGIEPRISLIISAVSVLLSHLNPVILETLHIYSHRYRYDSVLFVMMTMTRMPRVRASTVTVSRFLETVQYRSTPWSRHHKMLR
jgi:hypothetical protein